ncbi:hypothetical protein GOODEAATRI_029302 [Goodea atripinnis]|uniref:Uncharacterized protein n=1 Tax=Goodea atripinnis TaxID=208336 RepID=A0ABV0PSM3_9TELE
MKCSLFKSNDYIVKGSIESVPACLKFISAATSRSCKLSTFWKPSPTLEDHTPPDKLNPGSSFCSSYLCQTPYSLLTDSFSQTGCPCQPARSPTLHGLSDLDSRCKPSRNKAPHQ